MFIFHKFVHNHCFMVRCSDLVGSNGSSHYLYMGRYCAYMCLGYEVCFIKIASCVWSFSGVITRQRNEGEENMKDQRRGNGVISCKWETSGNKRTHGCTKPMAHCIMPTTVMSLIPACSFHAPLPRQKTNKQRYYAVHRATTVLLV